MYFSSYERKILSVMDSLSDFSIPELYPRVTELPCTRCQTQGDLGLASSREHDAGDAFPLGSWLVIHDHEATILSEINRVQDFCLRLVDLRFLKTATNAKNRDRVVFASTAGADQVSLLQPGRTLEMQGTVRYLTSRNFPRFIKGEMRSGEVHLESGHHLERARVWLPLVVSLVALALSSVPAWSTFLSKNQPTKVQIEPNTTQDEMENDILDRLNLLERRIDYLNLKGQVFDR